MDFLSPPRVIPMRPYNPTRGGLGSSAFARRYLRNHYCFLFPGYLDGSLHPVWPCRPILFRRRSARIAPRGLPHSAIRGSMDMCSSPRLFAAYHGLLRLAAPRHSPWTYVRLTILSFPAPTPSAAPAHPVKRAPRRLVFGAVLYLHLPWRLSAPLLMFPFPDYVKEHS